MTAPTLDQRLKCRDVPASSPVMFQRWSDLLFLHWRWDPAEIQATLPPGLHVDTFADEAWMGVVPFWMQGVRPRGLPALPWLSWFLELNLRTYVHDDDGNPGVWFYSLDCNQTVAVALARRFFGLNYVHACQSGERPVDSSRRRFRSDRTSTGGKSAFSWVPHGDGRQADPGSLEFFLVERYALFAHHRERLMTGRVWHEPYPIHDVNLDEESTSLWVDQNFSSPNRPPDHTLCSPGVSVSIFPLLQA